MKKAAAKHLRSMGERTKTSTGGLLANANNTVDLNNIDKSSTFVVVPREQDKQKLKGYHTALYYGYSLIKDAPNNFYGDAYNTILDIKEPKETDTKAKGQQVGQEILPVVKEFEW